MLFQWSHSPKTHVLWINGDTHQKKKSMTFPISLNLGSPLVIKRGWKLSTNLLRWFSQLSTSWCSHIFPPIKRRDFPRFPPDFSGQPAPPVLHHPSGTKGQGAEAFVDQFQPGSSMAPSEVPGQVIIPNWWKLVRALARFGHRMRKGLLNAFFDLLSAATLGFQPIN